MKEPLAFEELERDGARRVYNVRVPSDRVTALSAARLKEIGQSLRLPGFRPGKIPEAVIAARYGLKVRGEVIHQLSSEAADLVLTRNELATSAKLSGGAEAGDVEFHLEVTHLADLPPIDFATLKLERLTAAQSELTPLGLTASAAQELFENHLRQQVLDALDTLYRFPIAQGLVNREYALIRHAAEAAIAADSTTQTERAALAAELQSIAERRVRLGAVVTEMARRYEIKPAEEDVRREASASETLAQTRDRLKEQRLVELVISKAQVSDRAATSEELRALADAAG